MEGLYGFSGQDPTPFTKVSDINSEIYVLKSKEESFRTTLAAPLPKCPVAPSFAIHWLAVEGVQPKISPNPTAASATGPRRKKMKLGSAEAKIEGGREVKMLVKHVLSQELQLYYEKTTEAIIAGDEKLQNVVYISLAEDPGLHQLIPYLTQFISEQVTQHLRKLPLLLSLMRMLQSMLMNPHLHVELYVSYWIVFNACRMPYFVVPVASVTPIHLHLPGWASPLCKAN
jgi:transcription initiation factor TFIID subunit 6